MAGNVNNYIELELASSVNVHMTVYIAIQCLDFSLPVYYYTVLYYIPVALIVSLLLYSILHKNNIHLSIRKVGVDRGKR